MKKFMVTLITAALVAVGVQAVTSAPAQADNAYIKHYAPDNGYDVPMKVRCDDDTTDYVVEGYTAGGASSIYCPDGVSDIYVRDGEQIACLYNGKWIVKFDVTARHPVASTFNDGAGCVMQVD